MKKREKSYLKIKIKRGATKGRAFQGGTLSPVGGRNLVVEVRREGKTSKG